MNPAKWLAILLSFAGVGIISTKGSGLMTQNLQGVLLCVAGAVCYGIFNVLNKKKGMDQLLCTAIYFSVTAVCSAPALVIAGGITPMSGVTWAGMLWLGVFIDALAIFAWGAALQMSDVSVLSNLAYLTPVAAMIVSYLALREPIEGYAVIGMLFVLSGCLLQVFSNRRCVHPSNQNEGKYLRLSTNINKKPCEH